MAQLKCDGGKKREIRIRPDPREPIVRKDVKRKPALEALVKIQEANDDFSAKELNAWKESIKI
ncbi:MAG: hypothetical protein ACYCWK_10195 [Cuniculiplasma sp.]